MTEYKFSELFYRKYLENTVHFKTMFRSVFVVLFFSHGFCAANGMHYKSIIKCFNVLIKNNVFKTSHKKSKRKS